MQCPFNKRDHTSRSRARTWRVSNNLARMRDKYPSCYFKKWSLLLFIFIIIFTLLKKGLFPLSRPSQELNRNRQRPRKKVGVLVLLSYYLSARESITYLQFRHYTQSLFYCVSCRSSQRAIFTSNSYSETRTRRDIRVYTFINSMGAVCREWRGRCQNKFGFFSSHVPTC